MLIEKSLPELRARQVRACKGSASQVGILDICTHEISASEIGLIQDSIIQASAAKIGAAEIGTASLRSVQLCREEDSSGEIGQRKCCFTKVSACKAGTL